VGSGSYLITHNSIDCGWANGAATGINVFAQAFAPEASAIVVNNDVTMSAPEGTVFGGASSAGIAIRGFAQANWVLNNRIRGRARAALAVMDLNGGIPGSNSFVANDLDGFQSSLTDIFVDAGGNQHGRYWTSCPFRGSWHWHCDCSNAVIELRSRRPFRLHFLKTPGVPLRLGATSRLGAVKLTLIGRHKVEASWPLYYGLRT